MDKFERFHEAESKNRTCSGFAEASKRWDEIQLQKLRDLPIEGVAERLGLRVERHKCLCPFHDDHTPSLSFKNNKFRCWSCGESGGTIDLVMKYQNVDFKEACRWLSPLPAPPLGECHRAVESSPITGIYSQRRGSENEALPQRGSGEGADVAARYSRYFEHPFLNAEARHFLFDERKLDERVVRWCRLNSFRDKQGIPWLQIPYYDRAGKLVGVQNRNLETPSNSPLKGEKAGDSSAKDSLPLREGWGGSGGLRFRFPRGSRCGIYNLPVLNLLKPGEDLYIAEGCSDCWALLSAGHKAIAIPSATLLTKPVLDQLLQALPPSPTGEGTGVRLHMYPDRDAPGERLFLQLKEVLPGLEHHQLPPGCKDVSDLYLKGQIQNSKLINSKL